MLRYRQRLNNGQRIDYQINVYNLMNKKFINPIRFSDLDNPTSPLSRYDLPVPQEIRATITYSF
jgi:hypothetical protein